MRVPYEAPEAFTRKGKLFFITSLEKHRDLSALLSDIDFVFKNPQTREVVLYFKQAKGARLELIPAISNNIQCN